MALLWSAPVVILGGLLIWRATRLSLLASTVLLVLTPVLAVLARLAAAFVLRAIAGERLLERVRADRERLAALEGAKSEFLRLASHELRGPVGVVRGYVSMLEDGTLGVLPDSAQSVLPILLSRLKSIGLMVDLMMETARLDDERLQLHVESTDLRELVTECVEEMRPIAGPEHSLQVDAPRAAVVAPADRTRISTIVNNLIDNAIKYSPGGGQVRCCLEQKEGKALIAVTDHGIGIAEQDVGKLFGRYSRVGGDKAAQIPGTGLGLYVSRELARLHGGDLQVRSRPGLGSTFTLELPAGRE